MMMPVLAGVIVFALSIITPAPQVPPPPDLTAQDNTKHTVKFILTGTATNADITYPSGSGNVDTQVKLPWQTTETFTGDPYIFFYATNLGYSGTISMEVDKDGAVWKKVNGPDPTNHVSIGEMLHQNADN